jgi:hypothetical protein
MKTYVNGFNYDEEEKKIVIQDVTQSNKFNVIWENVEKDVAEKARKLFSEAKDIDTILRANGCKRFWE